MENLCNRLTSEELQTITDYVIDNGGIGKMEVSPAYMLRFWNEAKQDLSTLFGDKLILSQEVDFSKPLDWIVDEIEENLFEYNSNSWKFFRDFDVKCVQALCGTRPLWYEDNAEFRALRKNLFELEKASNLAKNIYSGETFSIPIPNQDKKLIISHGSKISKILGKIAKYYDIKYYEDFRLKHSLCLNQKKMSGKLCLSIHPLDYMTMSDNDCGWDSCMSWTDEGSYRQGTVEMMNSSYMVVAYLESKEPYHMSKENYWTNKKWRQLFIVDKNIIMGIKAYPYQSDELEQICLDWLKNLAEQTNFSTYLDTITNIDNNCRNYFSDFDKKITINFYMNHMYNDITDNHHAYLSKTFPAHEKEFSLNLSGVSECMCCGCEFDADEGDEELLVCYDCHDYPRCAECGRTIKDDEGCSWIDDMPYCYDCYDEVACVCACCEEVVHRDHINTIHLMHQGKVTDYTADVCDLCLEDDDFSKRYGRVTSLQHPIFGYYMLALETENITEEGLELLVPYGPAQREYREEKTVS